MPELRVMKASQRKLIFVTAAWALEFGWQNLFAEIQVAGEATPRKAPTDLFGPAQFADLLIKKGLYLKRYNKEIAATAAEADAALVEITSWTRQRFAEMLSKPADRLEGEFAAYVDLQLAEQKREAAEETSRQDKIEIVIG